MIKAIVKKEMKELLKSKEFISYYIMLIIVIGIMIPISSKESILNRNWYVMGFLFQIIASVIPSGLTADSFAGEKERKTIETLFNSPVPLIYIFLGKVIYIVIVTLIIMTIIFGISYILFIIMNFIEYKNLIFNFYSFKAIYFIFINSLIVCFFTTFLGVLISLRSKTVKAANLFNYFISMPIIAPVLGKLYTGTMPWSFILIYQLILFIGIGLLLVIIKNKFKIHSILENM
ncbi:ABC transporter permease subunit [Tissierella pigra]|uniref:ABC transporter permease subunit n=1 Tax=Tissierella pigra TaxID=2607614 RepID=A0A6N7XSP6_9FIRM|nr:ABC transporter permease [Tissierella pigra]MBU5426105.1 ABC transporter permease subunit [Tissierella pigra]MSU00777.1 ABC transporter permease subunit [Tissierella pigra]